MEKKPIEQLPLEGLYGPDIPAENRPGVIGFKTESGTTHIVTQACLGHCSILKIVPEWTRPAVLEETAENVEAKGGRVWCSAGPSPGQAPGRYVCRQAESTKSELSKNARLVKGALGS